MLKEYQQVIDDQLDLVETLSYPNQDNSIHYMPHHPVIKQDRAIYDQSANSL